MSPDAKKTKTILCVDDEEGILNALRRLIHRLSFPVIAARDGKEAIELIQTKKPDLIILDVHMPKMGGIEVLKWIRENEMAEIPVVMLTGDRSDSSTLKGYSEGSVYYITKPFSNEYVRNIINYLIGDLTAKEREILEQSL